MTQTGLSGGGPGFTIPDEIVPELEHDRGMVSVAKTAASNGAGSQFFVCYTENRGSTLTECTRSLAGLLRAWK